MCELRTLLEKREMASTTNFDPLKHRVRCYAHIINICATHIIASVSPTKSRGPHPSPLDSNDVLGSGDSSDDSDFGPEDEAQLSDDDNNDNDDNDDDKTLRKRWILGLKRDPLTRARKLIRFLRSSDQRREGLQTFIRDGNKHGWFTEEVNGERTEAPVPEAQLLRDVRTRWDSVYLMLRRLRELRPVSYLIDRT